MAYTRTIPVNSVAPSQITTKTFCSEVFIGEDPSTADWPTTDLLFSTSLDQSGNLVSPRRLVLGSEYPIPRKLVSFGPLQIVGYVQCVNAVTINLFIDEKD